MNTILVTGAAGFIGYHLSMKLLIQGMRVVGFDNLNGYYDVQLKKDRLSQLQQHEGFTFVEGDLVDYDLLKGIFSKENPTIVVNLAAQVGVRYSLENPAIYIQSNLVGFGNILECCRHHSVDHLVFASSSSVYGNSTEMPLSTNARVDKPISLYAATKKANELMAYTYSHLYGLPVTGLRFFTVYGPWGRPDMAPLIFTKAILEGRPINVFNQGKMQRDFTYVGDIVEGIQRVMQHPPTSQTNIDTKEETESLPYKIYNIGNNKPIELMHFISVLEGCLNKKAQINFLPAQPGDVLATFADVSDLKRDLDFTPNTSIEEGLKLMVEWYLSYVNYQEPK